MVQRFERGRKGDPFELSLRRCHSSSFVDGLKRYLKPILEQDRFVQTVVVIARCRPFRLQCLRLQSFEVYDFVLSLQGRW